MRGKVISIENALYIVFIWLYEIFTLHLRAYEIKNQ